MKKYTVIGLMFMSLLLASTTYGIKIEGPIDTKRTKITEECIGGYLYIVAIAGDRYGRNSGVSVVQVFKEGKFDDKPPQPKRCSGGKS